MACFSSCVPPAGVYFVKLSLMARIAACLMLSGVGKVRLSGAEIDDVDAFAAKTVGVGGHLHGG